MYGFCYVEIAIMRDTISHNGVIDRIEGQTVYVKISQLSACAGCHAKSACMAADRKDKIIEATDISGRFQPNEEVIVYGQTSMGLFAVFLAFVLPLCLVLAVTVSGILLGWAEQASALVGLSMLVPYYGILYLCRDKLKNKFIFTIEKQKTNLEQDA